jgi:hypothetical protein
MEAHLVLVPRHLGGVRAAIEDRDDLRRVGNARRLAADEDAIADLEPDVAGEPLVDRDGPERPRRGDRIDALLQECECVRETPA